MQARKNILVFSLVIALLLGVIAVRFFCVNRVVEKNYYEMAGFTSGHYFSRVKEAKGEPLDESWVEANGLYRKQLIYDGYEYTTFFASEPDYFRDYTVSVVTITDQAYRIGSRKVGIGSTRKKIERAYWSSSRISGLENENDIGFIDGGVWVEFRFAPDDTVNQIRIYNGP